MTVLLATFGGVLGAAFGSFLNVVIVRVPRGDSITKPPSRCPTCGTLLLARDNVPILSYLVLRGRCRRCRSPIGIRYPLVEAATVVLFVAAVLRFAAIEEAAFVAAASAVLLALAAIDLEHRRLPNVIVLPSTVVALVWVGAVAVVTGDMPVFVTAVACGAAAFTLLFLIAFISGGMGMGDVKLAAFIGVVTGRFGWEVTVLAVFASFIVGGLIAIALLVLGRAGRKTAVPFGPSLAVGAVLALFVGPWPVRAWLGL